MPDQPYKLALSRRQFIQGSLACAALSGCSTMTQLPRQTSLRIPFYLNSHSGFI
ncbi:MAG: twin-arginine translocation signal domain-containing protein [Deltaproteobacteria bacterium]|nr:twin-arginine translocation signal domain-containing protein [Deltaproteobacteria bacterium]